ncbi:hypothetical protein C8Q77DRAFT_1214381 [Trametes polyzona]|nr:hypothetical protein C8Q77DRAFT_1214381 [Trametes polyzona]
MDGGNGSGEREKSASREEGTAWSSSPPANPSGTQERAADDSFFRTGPVGDFVSAAPMNSNVKPSSFSPASGFASASALARNDTGTRAFSGFASASTLSAQAQSHPGAESADASTTTPFVPPKVSGFGRASALPLLAVDDRSPSPPPPQDYDSWFESDASVLPPDAFAFKTARNVLDTSEQAAEPEEPPSQVSQFGGFTSGLAQWKTAPQASQAEGSASEHKGVTMTVGFTPATFAGFESAAHVHGGKPNWAAPSAEALARAVAKMKEWDTEFEHEAGPSGSQNVENNAPPNSRPPSLPLVQTPLRPALRPMENGFSPVQPPETPTPAGAAPKDAPHFTVIAGMQIKNKPFKSPLITRPQAQPRSVSAPTSFIGSPLNPSRSAGGFRVASSSKLPAAFTELNAATGSSTTTDLSGVSSFTSPVKADTSAFVSPMKAGTSFFASPVKALGMTPRRVGMSPAAGKGKFSTPFKPGMRPGEPGRTQLEQQMKEEQLRVVASGPVHIHAWSAPSKKGKERKEYRFFDLNPPTQRQSLESSGLRPLSYDDEELEDMGINVDELRQMRPSNAIYYKFHSAVPTAGIEDPAESQQLGPEAAFAYLQERGCHLATQEWVTNHYGLILWKLAGLVCLEPEREQDPQTKRWCWPEVIRQLLYRYERELNGGSRPALRLISTEDAPAACPMVLCVSNIVTRGSSFVDKSGVPFEPHPELEVTDGWYRLRATVDMPLARAIRRGRISIGTKLAISGARLSGDRKEPCEVLEAYDNTVLELTGNGTNLAPWHAKLGFVKQPFIATLDKLTPDGGTVPAMDVIITKTYPIAFIEFERNEDGTVSRVGPRDEKEELKAHDKWLSKRETGSSKIRERLHAHVQYLLKLSDRLYARAGPQFEASLSRGDPMPNHIESLYEEMMDEYNRPSQAWDRLDAFTAGWLHVYCKEQADLAAARIPDDLAKELQDVCPPRNVRDFRVVVAKDARWRKKEPFRTVQITLWDPLKVVFSENGNPGEIKEGQRFLVTNLMPNQANAWMAPGPEAEVYLVAKRASRWTNIRSAKS